MVAAGVLVAVRVAVVAGLAGDQDPGQGPVTGQPPAGLGAERSRPANGDDARSGDQRRADALTELARRALEQGQLPQTGGVRPPLLVTVDLDSLLGRPGAVGGELDSGMGPLEPEACRRLACDGAVTRVLVSRQPSHHGHQGDPGDPDGHHGDPGEREDPGGPPGPHAPGRQEGLADRLQAAMAVLPPTLGGPPSQPLDLGRASRVITPAQRNALAVRDRGCVFPDCTRPLAWCEGHHLVHWADGGPTDAPKTPRRRLSLAPAIEPGERMGPLPLGH